MIHHIVMSLEKWHTIISPKMMISYTKNLQDYHCWGLLKGQEIALNDN